MASTLAALNDAPIPDFVAALGAVLAHAPWVAEGAAAQRPFPTVEALFRALRDGVQGASDARRLALLAGYPDLAGPAARSRTIAPDAVAEQAAAGLDRLSEAEYARFAALNAAYRERFGLPFILCVGRHGRASLLANVESRLASSPDAERRTAEAEVMRIAAIRLNALVTGAGPLTTTGRISTHVLDTVQGRPAAGVAVELVEFVSATETAVVARAVTNADGRTDLPLIHGRPVPMATYELRFGLGDHFRRVGAAHGPALPEPPFLDIVPLRFGVGDPEGHYHVPLVATPWSYQTYRGS
ncbi:2-oxo-4-hydroxy-4-carboxy-5-ureidoimidazoline decarboxylase [Methylobacterium sp. J-090]|uniref:2-oxo-4-hydroxy-4-carboxy-5-ureidoimidazoline decarboxylase n=1 Tax=Methylobacterium sp. J-090 TaxID=2836666 RepID=UPI001FBA70B3|nr:2-oxo-4-hydroxy-4-carboxy-5-ureidoimidazoline decarboxylase [Methylobacterium sp. J-090]MCJ2082621.1 2-oxo-4-hydroxy-4-carboxy-5-ureidoimidazoline decarboxylase [Methylobacterium sp. J-090]